jgi:hypothetical protein
MEAAWLGGRSGAVRAMGTSVGPTAREEDEMDRVTEVTEEAVRAAAEQEAAAAAVQRVGRGKPVVGMAG